MHVHHQHTETQGSWYIEEAGERLAALDYAVIQNGSTLSLDSTRVDDRLRGKGAGKQLVAASVEYARKHNLKLKPVCPFVVALFDKMQEWSDVRV